MRARGKRPGHTTVRAGRRYHKCGNAARRRMRSGRCQARLSGSRLRWKELRGVYAAGELWDENFVRHTLHEHAMGGGIYIQRHRVDSTPPIYLSQYSYLSRGSARAHAEVHGRVRRVLTTVGAQTTISRSLRVLVIRVFDAFQSSNGGLCAEGNVTLGGDSDKGGTAEARPSESQGVSAKSALTGKTAARERLCFARRVLCISTPNHWRLSYKPLDPRLFPPSCHPTFSFLPSTPPPHPSKWLSSLPSKSPRSTMSPW